MENKAQKVPEKINRYYSFKELANLYSVHPETLRKELRLIPGMTVEKYQRLICPKYVQKIIEHLGAF